MSETQITALVLAAGLGTRMKSSKPKVMHAIAGRPMIGHVLHMLTGLSPQRIVTIVGPDMPDLEAEVAPHPTAVQHDRLGTADAVKASRQALSDVTDGVALIVYGDSPFLRAETLQAMVARCNAGASVVVLGFEAADPTGYGRLVQSGNGSLERIVEHRDASEEERAITLCNSGVMAIDAQHLFPLIDDVRNDNAKGEYYLTDVVGLARDRGLQCEIIEAPEDELQGVDSPVNLASAEAWYQNRARQNLLESGVSMLDPTSVWLSWDTEIAPGTEIGRNVVFAPGVSVDGPARIRDFCHLEGVLIHAGAEIGPFARLRPGTEIGAGAKIGNFVEVKNALFEDGAKANHLSYIGDARVGAKANIGAGTITCNYDGFLKSKTDIGAGAFIGSNTALVAPVKIGDGAIVGAGSTMSSDVEADAIAVTRAEETHKPEAAKRFRAKRAEAKKQAAEKKTN